MRAQNQPVYLYLFCHTEDHINLELSSERYERLLPVLKEVKKNYEMKYPNRSLSASYQFYGADTQVFLDSLPALIDTVISYRDQGVIETGYHGAHEPTHAHNFFTEINMDPAWEQLSLVAEKHFSWYRDLYRFYPVDSAKLGGLAKYQSVLGDPKVISGQNPYTYNHVTYHSAIIHQLKKLSKVRATFGFDDHGPAVNKPTYWEGVDSIMTILCPTPDHPRELFYMGHLLRISNTDGFTKIITLRKRKTELLKSLNSIDRSNAHLIGLQVGFKYIYTKPTYSPTNYAYANPENPGLPPEGLLSRADIDLNYDRTESNLHFLADTFMQEHPECQFISNTELLERFPSANFTDIPQSAIQNAVIDLLDQWQGRPPAFVTASTHYFSLSDLYQLLISTLAEYHKTLSFPEKLYLSTMWGPFLIQPVTTSFGSVSIDTILSYCETMAASANDTSWTQFPVNTISDIIQIDTHSLNAAEFLKLMAKTYLKLIQDNKTNVKIDPSLNAPATYDIYRRHIGDINIDLTWTMKPVMISDATTKITPKTSKYLSHPDNFVLYQNYPNPFNMKTTIGYSVTALDGQYTTNNHFRLEIFNTMGEKIKTLCSGNQSSGHHLITWDGTDNSGSTMGSGLYIIRGSMSNQSQQRKILLLK